MIEQDTIKLLRECDAGTKMGIASIDDVLHHVSSDKFSQMLNTCKKEHEKLQGEILQLLTKYHDDSYMALPRAPDWALSPTTMGLFSTSA